MSEHDFIIWLKGFIAGTNPITPELRDINAKLKFVIDSKAVPRHSGFTF